MYCDTCMQDSVRYTNFLLNMERVAAINNDDTLDFFVSRLFSCRMWLSAVAWCSFRCVEQSAECSALPL